MFQQMGPTSRGNSPWRWGSIPWASHVPGKGHPKNNRFFRPKKWGRPLEGHHVMLKASLLCEVATEVLGRRGKERFPWAKNLVVGYEMMQLHGVYVICHIIRYYIYFWGQYVTYHYMVCAVFVYMHCKCREGSSWLPDIMFIIPQCTSGTSGMKPPNTVSFFFLGWRIPLPSTKVML